MVYKRSSCFKKVSRKVEKLSLWFLPIVFLLLVIILHYSNGKFYLQYTDPEYFHLFNGLNLSIFNLAVDYIDHPGTTVQLLFAISAHIVNLMLPGGDIITNALNNPEEFIHAANLLLNIICAIALFLLGYHTFKYTGNISLSLLMQLTLFLGAGLLIISARILPESVLIVVLLFLVILIIKYIYENEEGKSSRTYAVAFAIVSGLGMATKISYLPFLFIPFILLQSKNRWLYALYSLPAIVIFAFPLFVNLGKSWRWFGNMFLHSGKWGSGEANLMDISLIPERLLALYKIDKIFFYIIGMGIVVLVLCYTLPILKRTISLKYMKRALLAINISLLFSIFLITKHFAYHYFIPNLVFKSFIIFLIAIILNTLSRSKKVQRFISLSFLIIAIWMIIPQINLLHSTVSKKQKEASKFEERERILSTYNKKENLLIISPHYRGSPFKQSAMAGGFMLSGQLRSTFKELLMETFPHSIIYVNWSEQFYLWDTFLDANEFIETQKPVYIFIGEGKENDLDIILERIENDLPNLRADLELLHHFTKPDEFFYRLNFRD